MIDFDLADKEGTYYPASYVAQYNLPCRHSDAYPSNQRKKEHDIYTLKCLAKEAFPNQFTTLFSSL